MKHLGRLCPGLSVSLALLGAAGPGWGQQTPEEGALVRLQIQRFAAKAGEGAAGGPVLRAFTGRPHLLGGASFVMVAPEHPMLKELTLPVLWEQVRGYADEARKKSLLERTDLARQTAGMFLGSYAINPLNGWRMPVWVSGFLMGDYPGQAVLGIPAHEPWMFAFARAQGIEVVPVIRLRAENGAPVGASLRQAYRGEGTLVESGELTGLAVTEARGRENPAFAAALSWLEKGKLGEAVRGPDYLTWVQVRRQEKAEKKSAAVAKARPGGKGEPVAAPSLAKKPESREQGKPAPAEPARKEAPLPPAPVLPQAQPQPQPAVGVDLGKAVLEATATEVGKQMVVEVDALMGVGLNRMVDRCWLLSKPRLGMPVEAGLFSSSPFVPAKL